MGRRDDDLNLVRLYLRQLGEERLLTKDEEQELARTIEAGARARRQLQATSPCPPALRAALEEAACAGERARQRFVRANLRLVVAVARQWTRSGLPLLDLIQEGNLGLMRAVDGFDYRRGFRFSTYATWWIRQAIRRGVATSARMVRLPVHAGEELTRVLGAQRLLEERPADGVPMLESLAEATGLPAAHITTLLRLAREPASISQPLGDESGDLACAIPDTTAVAPDAGAVAALLPVELERLLATLDSRDREVVSLRFGLAGDEPWTLEAVGQALGISRESVRQAQVRALRILRRAAAASPEIRELLTA